MYLIRTSAVLLFTLSNFIFSSSFSLPSVPANGLGLEWYKWTLLRKIEFIRKILWGYSIKRKPGDVDLEIYGNQRNHRGNFKIVSLIAKTAWCSSPASGMNPAVSGYLSLCPLLSFQKKEHPSDLGLDYRHYFLAKWKCCFHIHSIRL